MTLTVEDRRLLSHAYDRMFDDAEKGDADALGGLADPFWVYYADLFLGGYDRMHQEIEWRIQAREQAS